MGKIHYLKTWPEFFQAVRHGDKTFEIRKNDRPGEPYEVGDILVLQEFDPKSGYTGSEDIWLDVPYMLDKQPFVPEGYVCMAIKEEVKPPMKPLRYITTLIITLACIFAVYSIRETSGNIKRLTGEIEGFKRQITEFQIQIDNASRVNNDTLVEHLKSITRENENLKQENLDLRTQMEAFGHWWKGGRE